MNPGNCKCFVCNTCFQDHGGYEHSWVDPSPCAGNKGYSTGNFDDWCTLQRDHRGKCHYKSDVSEGFEI